VSSRSARPLASAIALALLSGSLFAQDGSPMPGDEAVRRGKAEALPEVEVEGFRAEQAAGVKYSRPLQETPRIITVLPDALLREQGVTSLKDALRNQPGISLQAGEGNPPGGDQLKIRGFNARDDIHVNGARDIGNYFRDPFYVDQIEIVKGPNSSFAGRGTAGGAINFVTKTPTLGDHGHVEVGVGSDDFRRVTADLNRQVSEDSAYRVNFLGHDAGIPGRDVAEEQRHGVYAVYAWGIGGATQISADLLYLRQNDLPDAGLPADRDPRSANSRGTGRIPPGLDFDNFYGHVDDYKDVHATLFGLTAEHAFASGALLRNQLRVSEVENDSITSSPRIRNIPAASPGFEGAQVRGDTKPRDQVDDGVSNQTSLNFSLDTGAVRHDLVAGIEFGSYSYKNRRRPDVSGALTDLYNPLPRRRPATPYDGTTHRFQTDELAYYVLDTLALAPQWDLHLGLRHDRVEAEAREFGRENLPTPGDNRRLSRTDEETSWNAGLVYKFSPEAMVYASVASAFEISGNFDRNQIQLAGGATARIADAATFQIGPEKTTAFELGGKWLLADNLAFNAALFQTDKDDARFPGQAGGDNSVLDNELRVRGLELLAAGDLSRAWKLYAGYTYLDGEVLASPSRPFAVGQELGGTPEHTFTLFTTYDVSERWSVGGGVQHVAEQFGSVQASATGTVKVAIPDYTLLDLYTTFRFTEQLALRVNLYNASDERYISQLAEGGGQGIPGPGRQLVGTLRYSF
jgi:catecholate siderophore receptor